MDFDKETPIPPIDYVWEYQSLAHTREENRLYVDDGTC